MTSSESSPAPGWWARRRAAAAAKDPRDRFAFTDDGCRWEIRLGALTMLVAIFLWLWLGPANSIWVYLAGVPLFAIGVVVQAVQGRKHGRPGYPWKLALIFTIGGLVMWPDLLYRETVDGAIGVQPIAPLVLLPGLWALLWWPLARPAVRQGSEFQS